MKKFNPSDVVCIYRKTFKDPAVAGDSNGTLVQIYYLFDEKTKFLGVEDYSIHFIIDGEVGQNVANDKEEVDDELYRFLFKTTYLELINNVILKKKKK